MKFDLHERFLIETNTVRQILMRASDEKLHQWLGT